MNASRIKNHFVYWILPSAVTLICIFTYFLDPFGLSEIMAPAFNREFGVVENLQLIILLLLFIQAIRGTSAWKSGRYFFMFIAAITVLLILEEIDYGLHYYDYFTGKSKEEIVHEIVVEKRIRNIHNNGELTNVLKLASYAILAIFFVIFPLLPQREKEKRPLLSFLSPSHKIIPTVVCLILINQVALYLYRFHDYSTQSLSSNVSEFEEFMFYYIILLYVAELVNKPEGLVSFKFTRQLN